MRSAEEPGDCPFGVKSLCEDPDPLLNSLRPDANDQGTAFQLLDLRGKNELPRLFPKRWQAVQEFGLIRAWELIRPYNWHSLSARGHESMHPLLHAHDMGGK